MSNGRTDGAEGIADVKPEQALTAHAQERMCALVQPRNRAWDLFRPVMQFVGVVISPANMAKIDLTFNLLW
ncbi:hypothetical protein [Streptomyces chrestomyceticus]|uniref:Uncharacterized protein n=1 Tax=Streptomyces chrestomyceticus TaxID=68185 RepID=A0ABU7WQI0_9ACTN